MKAFIKVIAIASIIAVPTLAVAHMNNSFGGSQFMHAMMDENHPQHQVMQQLMSDPEAMQQWRDQMQSDPEARQQWMEQMHNYSAADNNGFRYGCHGRFTKSE